NYTSNMGFYCFNDLNPNDVTNYADHLSPFQLFAGYGVNYPFTYYAPTKTMINGLNTGGDYTNPTSQADAIRNASSGTGPYFLSLTAGSGRTGSNTSRTEYTWGDQPNRIYQIQQNLLANPKGKTYHFLTPKDWAATWKAWKGYQSVSSGTAPTPAPNDPAWT